MKLNFLKLNGFSILEQLQLEEAILRADTENWCIINSGTSPAIVMGISTVLEDVLEVGKPIPLPIIRRFSGGGTVVVDDETFFCTFIMGDFAQNPQEVMKWSKEVYAPAFLPYQLQLLEHDYALDGRKIGGNAQCFVKGRMVHHTSFLWSWKPERMEMLKVPTKQPAYRKNRPHESFCVPLSSYFSSRELFTTSVEQVLINRFACEIVSIERARGILERPHRKSTTMESAWLTH